MCNIYIKVVWSGLYMSISLCYFYVWHMYIEYCLLIVDFGVSLSNFSFWKHGNEENQGILNILVHFVCHLTSDIPNNVKDEQVSDNFIDLG